MTALTVTKARDQRGDALDGLLNDERILGMVGWSYPSLTALRLEAHRLSESYPTVEYTDGVRLYRYDGSPHMGRVIQVITDLGPYGGLSPQSMSVAIAAIDDALGQLRISGKKEIPN